MLPLLHAALPLRLQAWEVLDPPSGWDVSGPVLATGYYHVSATVLQQVMMIDDALAHACHQGERQQWWQQDAVASLAGLLRICCVFGLLLFGDWRLHVVCKRRQVLHTSAHPVDKWARFRPRFIQSNRF